MNPLANDLERILSRHTALWEDLRGARILISGGTGFFGCWLLESLAWANATRDLNISATVLTRNVAGFQRKAPHLAAHPAFTFLPGDVRSFSFPSGAFDCVIHGAATSAAATFQGEDPLVKFDTIVTGTRRVLDFALQCGAQRFLYISSGSCYGKVAGGTLSEECPCAPDPGDLDAAMGNGKRAAEFLCAYYAKQYGLAVKIARCFSFIGPYLPLDIHYAIGNFIRDALWRDEVLVKGDGLPLRTYLYAADLLVWLLTIMIQGSVGRPYNVGSDQVISIADLARLVRDELAPQKPVRILAPMQQAACASPPSYIPNIERATGELGLIVETQLSEAISKTAAYCRLQQLP